MTCENIRESIPSRDAGDLSALEQQRVDQHLESCEECRAFRERYARTLNAAKQWQPVMEDREALFDKLMSARPAPRAERPSFRIAPVFISALAASLATVFLMRAFENDPAPPQEKLVVLVLQADGSLAPASADELAAWRENRAAPAATLTAVVVATPATHPAPARTAAPAPTAIVIATSVPIATVVPATPMPDASPAAAYARAEETLGDPAAAARLLEEIVVQWPSSPEATTSRLELARLYGGPLERPGRALAQLNVVLASDPDPTTRRVASALRCRISPYECTNGSRAID